jgi:peptide/nickel transport system substrate-binding protein
VEAPDPLTVRFRLKWPEASFLLNLSSPWNFIYKADILAKDMHWYEKNIMGTGPFTFVEHVKGAYWVGRKNPGYWDQGRPYLDGYRMLIVREPAAQVAAIRSERAHIQFRGFTPPERDTLIQALGPKVTVQESPWNCQAILAFNHEKPPFGDRRVRRALTLAIDRWEGSRVLSRIAIVKRSPGRRRRRGAQKLADWRDIAAARGAPAGGRRRRFAFTLTAPAWEQPFEPIAIWLIDRAHDRPQRHRTCPSGRATTKLRGGYESRSTVRLHRGPDLISRSSRASDHGGPGEISHANYALDRCSTSHVKQSRALWWRRGGATPGVRAPAFDEAHYATTPSGTIVPHSSRVRGWTLTPSHYLNHQSTPSLRNNDAAARALLGRLQGGRGACDGTAHRGRGRRLALRGPVGRLQPAPHG